MSVNDIKKKIKPNFPCFVLLEGKYQTNSGLPDPLFRIRPEPDLDFLLNQYPARIGSGIFFQINIRPEPDPDLFF